jgi:hypothetical protein
VDVELEPLQVRQRRQRRGPDESALGRRQPAADRERAEARECLRRCDDPIEHRHRALGVHDELAHEGSDRRAEHGVEHTGVVGVVPVALDPLDKPPPPVRADLIARVAVAIDRIEAALQLGDALRLAAGER